MLGSITRFALPEVTVCSRILVGGVEHAISGAAHFELRKARGAVGVQLQASPAGASCVLENGPHHASSGSSGDGKHPAQALGFVVLHLQQRVQALVGDLQPGGAREQPHVGVAAWRGRQLGRGQSRGEDGLRAGENAGEVQGAFCAQARRAACQRQQRVSGPGSHGRGVEPLVGPAGGVDGEAVIHPRSDSEEGLRGGHGDQIVVGAVPDPGARSAAHQGQPVPRGGDAVDGDVCRQRAGLQRRDSSVQSGHIRLDGDVCEVGVGLADGVVSAVALGLAVAIPVQFQRGCVT